MRSGLDKESRVPSFGTMPLYEFLCRRCQKEFEATQSIEEHSRQRPECPTCHSAEQVEPELSPFFARTSRKA